MSEILYDVPLVVWVMLPIFVLAWLGGFFCGLAFGRRIR